MIYLFAIFIMLYVLTAIRTFKAYKILGMQEDIIHAYEEIIFKMEEGNEI